MNTARGKEVGFKTKPHQNWWIYPLTTSFYKTAWSPTIVTPTFQYFYTDISAISVIFCNSGPWVCEAVCEVPVLLKLLFQLAVGLPHEPRLVFARGGVVDALLLPLVDVLLVPVRGNGESKSKPFLGESFLTWLYDQKLTPITAKSHQSLPKKAWIKCEFKSETIEFL